MVDCESIGLLIAPYIVEDAGLTPKERAALAAHLAACSACAAEYELSVRVIGAIRGLPADLLLQAFPVSGNPHTIEVSTADGPEKAVVAPARLSGFVPKYAEYPRVRPQVRKSRWLAPAALAAGLVLAATGWLWVHGLDGGQAGPKSTELASISPQLPIGIVRTLDVNGAGSLQPISAGNVLTVSRQEWKRLRIWDRHEVVLEPSSHMQLAGTEIGGCRLKLSSGRVYVSVHRSSGEGVFEVATPEAVLLITGTTFTVAADPGRTVLSVSEGTVQLTSKSGATRPVTAGQTCVTDGKSLHRTDALELQGALAVVGALGRDPAEIVRKSRWYRQRFAPLLALNDYLSAQKADVDELTTLAISSDLWCLQFAKDPKANSRAYVQRRAGLERAAAFHGYEVQWKTPADQQEALQVAKEALSAGHLVLGYGLAGDEDVQVLTADRLETVLSAQPRGYRFLEEAEAKPWNLAVVAVATSPVSARQRLVAEAVEDCRRLLEGLADVEYEVGKPAVQAWRGAVAAAAEDLRPTDPVLLALSALGKLAVSCQERYSGLGVVADAEGWLSSCEQLEGALGVAGAASTCADRADCQKDRRVRRQDITLKVSEALQKQSLFMTRELERMHDLP